MVKKRLQYILSITLFLFLMSPQGAHARFFRDHRPDAATGILAAFRGSCSSQGIFTRNAIAQTDAIVNIVQNLENTDACKPYLNSLTTIQTAANQIMALQQSPVYAAYMADQQNYQLLTLALQNSSPSSTSAQTLAAALDTLRVQMFTDQANYDVNTQTLRHNFLVNQAATMLTWGQTLANTTSSPGLMQCLEQSPAAAIQLGAQMAAFGGSFSPSVFGTAVGAGAQILSTGLALLRDRQYTHTIFQAQGNEMPDALNCALESMSEAYCSADDSYRLLDLARQNRVMPNYAASPLWRGIDILGRQLPALLQWLAKIQDEVPPQDSFQASKQNSVLQEIFQIQQQNTNAVAMINNSISQANFASNDDAKLSALVNAIAALSIQLASPSMTVTGPNSISTSSTPFSTYQPNAMIWACWLVNGPNIPNCPTIPPADAVYTGGVPTLAQVTDYIESSAALGVTKAQVKNLSATLLNNWNLLVPKVQVLVDSDFARIIATNAGTILSSARVASSGYPLSPLQVLQNIASFLNDMAQYDRLNPQLPLALTQEIKKVNDAITYLTAPDGVACPVQAGATPLTPDECQNQRLIAISKEFNLQIGTQVFLTDMNDLVNIDLQYRFTSGQIPQSVVKILQASGQDIDVALEMAGSGDLDPIADDLDSARSDYQENIQVFRRFFSQAFEKVVADEEAQAEADGETGEDGPNRPHAQRLAQLCMLWLLTSEGPGQGKGALNWPDQTTKNICDGTVYYNENTASDGAIAPSFEIGKLDQKIAAWPFRKRACLFHDYKIQNKADTLYIKPAGN